jgi:hypothetical protein
MANISHVIILLEFLSRRRGTHARVVVCLHDNELIAGKHRRKKESTK